MVVVVLFVSVKSSSLGLILRSETLSIKDSSEFSTFEVVLSEDDSSPNSSKSIKNKDYRNTSPPSKTAPYRTVCGYKVLTWLQCKTIRGFSSKCFVGYGFVYRLNSSGFKAWTFTNFKNLTKSLNCSVRKKTWSKIINLDNPLNIYLLEYSSHIVYSTHL